jgi:RNA binding exosome subunit
VSCRYIEISTIVHATESLDRVVEGLRYLGDLPIVIEILEGHYGNVIYLLTSFLENCDDLLKKLCKALGGQLPAVRDKDGVYYIRLDKQALIRGVFKVGEHDDVVRLKIRTKNVC